VTLAGPNDEVLRRFYAVRERVWQLENAADPFRGRQLRSLLERAGFNSVVATSKYICYGTHGAVASFGTARAEDCRRDDWYWRMPFQLPAPGNDNTRKPSAFVNLRARD
jgi:hypothetical protein